MPIKYEILEDKRLVLVKGSGVVTGRDVIMHLDALVADDRYSAPMKKLEDYRTIESINISSEEAESIANKKKTYKSKFHEERCAFVSPKDRTYGTSRVHQALVDNSDINTEVFRQIEEALKWLDLTLDNG
jgi:hypothetical protein